MSKLLLKLPPPIHPVQQQILDFILDPDPTTRLCIVPAGTKSGKSFINAVGVATLIHSERQQLCRWFAPQYIQSMIGLKYVRRFLPISHPNKKIAQMYNVTTSGTPSISFKPFDNAIQFLHAQKPELVEGEATRLNLLDEAAKYKNLGEFLQAVRTTTTFTKGKIILFSTPLGKNEFYTEYENAKQEMVLAKQNNRKPTALALHAPTIANPLIDPATIDYMRATMPARLFKQYVLAEFVDQSTVFGDFMQCVDNSQEVLCLHDEAQFWLHTNSDYKKRVVIGVDWGKQTDFTVFSAIDCSNMNQARLVGFQRFRRTSYIQAVKNLHLFQSNFEAITECYHDKTGVGLAIDDILYDEHVRADGITFTNENKTNMVISLMNFIEKNQMLLPQYKILFNELQNFEMSFTRTGKMHFAAATGATDDIICSVLLALLAYTDNGGSFELITLPEPQRNIYRHPQSGEYIDLDED